MTQNMLTTLNMIFGSNHGQAYVKSVLVYYNHHFFGQMPKNSGKVLFMIPFIVVLGTQI